MVEVGPNRFQVWWYDSVLGKQVDAYPRAGLATDRLEEVKQRKHFVRGVVIDMQEHLTGQENYPTQREFDQAHRAFTQEMFTHV